MTLEELHDALQERSIADAQIDRALAVLMGPDPSGVVPAVTREAVAHVAVYLHVKRDRSWIPSWAWVVIERGHPAARAIYWHELQELEGYRLLGVQPLHVSRDGVLYRQAHAWACWEEARYWQAWAAAEGQEIPAAALLRTHPLREPDEIEQVLDHLEATWRLALERPSVVALRRAREFYREKELTRVDVERWLR